jgi:hypothetical protein
MAWNAALAKLQWASTSGGTLNDVSAVGSVTFNISRPTLDVTPIGTPTSSFLAGVSTATATLDIFYDNDDANHAAWLQAINEATAKSDWLFDMGSGETIKGTGYVTSMDIVGAANSVGRATINIQFTATPASNAKAWTVTHTA